MAARRAAAPVTATHPGLAVREADDDGAAARSTRVASKLPTRRNPRTRHRKFSLRISTWAALWTAVVLGTAGTTFVLTCQHASEAALDEATRAAHDAWVSNGQALLDGQVDAALKVLENLYIVGNDLPHGSTQLVDMLLNSLMSNSNDLLPFQVVSTATPDGGYTAVGYSAASAQIGVGTAYDGKVVWRPIQGGQGVAIPGFVPTERDWYQYAIIEPDVPQIVGPSMGMDNKLHYSLVIAEPGSSQVWMTSMPISQVARLVQIAWPADSNHNSGFLVKEEDGDINVEWASTRFSNVDLSDAVEQLEHRDTYTTVIETDKGPHYLTIGRVFDDNDSAIWATSSAAEGLAQLDTSRLIFFATILGIGTLGVVASASWTFTRALRRARDFIAESASSTCPKPAPATYVTEVDDLAATARETISAQVSVADDLRASEARLARLYRHITERHDEQRRRLATDLHDGPLQEVLAVSLLEDRNGPETLEHLNRARDQIRAVNADLLGDEAGAAGFAERIIEIADEASIEGRFEVTATVPDHVALPEVVSRVLLRAARELLVNARKHSGSATAEVVVAATGDMVQLSVADRGVGFEAAERIAATRPNGTEGGYGLFSIEVEVTQLGGTIVRGENRNGGAAVTISIPLR